MKKIIVTCSLLFTSVISYSQATYVEMLDTRNVNDAPTAFKTKLSVDFKRRSVIGVPGINEFTGVLTIAPWSDYSGGKNHQISFNDGGVYYRVGNHTSPTWEAWRKLLIEDANGNVSIGIDDPQGYKLAVGGSMIAESVKVKLQGAWPDFVFAKNYQLPSLQETEQHILAKGHLPGIPSAAEVSKEGIELGEMNKKLLQKIEELTLYLIEIKKDAEVDRKATLALNEKVAKLEEELKISRKN